MALTTFAPPVDPSPGTGLKPTHKILGADFGDGYTQETPDGLNHIRMTLSLSWDGLTEAQMHAIWNYFLARKGTEPFYFQPAGEAAQLKWTCKEYSRNLSGVWRMSATLVQSFSNLT